MTFRLIHNDALLALRSLPDASVNVCITSPPYFGLRDYGVEGQIGLERTPEEYVSDLVEVFREVRRVLRDDGTIWLNLGDSYAGHNAPGWRAANEEKNRGASNKNGCGIIAGLKPKDLIGIPWRVAFALQGDGWWLRQDIIWHKPNPMPESVEDRCTKAHEYLFLLAKSERYYYDCEAIKTDGTLERSGNTQHKYVNGQHLHRTKSGFLEMRGKVYEKVNRRSVWTITSQPFAEAHFATFPEALAEPCVLAGCPEGGTVLDPFNGAGTTGVAALKAGRNYIGIDLNAEYLDMARRRLNAVGTLLHSEVCA